MISGLILRIAFRLLRARLKQSLVAATGVLFGIAAFIALVSFMNGLNQLLDGLILNRTPHIRLYNEIKPSLTQPLERSAEYTGSHHFIRSVKPRESLRSIKNPEVIIQSLRRDPRVIDVAPKVSTQIFYQSGTIEIAGLLNGIDPEREERLFSFSDYVISGDIQELNQGGNSIFLGKGIADKMMIEPGDVVQLMSAKGDLLLFKVAGILQFGLVEIDDTYSYAHISAVQQLLGEPASYITDLQLKVKDMEQAPAIALEFSTKYHVDAIDIQTANGQFDTGSNVRSIISYAVGITLLIVAGFGIYNILNMLIYEKMDSIAILKATGFSGKDVKYIFLTISLIIGIAGGISGLMSGYLLSVVIDNVPFETEALPTIKTFPIDYNPVYYVIGLIFSLVTTYVAGVFPARKASQIDPVIIIRGK